MRCLVREKRSRTDYLLGMDIHLLWNMSVQEFWHNSDHLMVMGCLCGTAQREHNRYLGRNWRFPLHPPQQNTGEDQ